jgi:2-oxoglutarate ferredoxin oxidoreductase subunit delta
VIVAKEDNQPTVQEAEAPAQKPRRRVRGEVRVFDNWCKGCGICIAFCPQQVFEANGEGRPKIAHPERCTGCHWCDTHCPDLAISVKRVEDQEG